MSVAKQLLDGITLIKLVKVPVGGYCKQDEQCHGSENSAVCKLGECVCRAGYVLFNLKCYEGKLNMLFRKCIITFLKDAYGRLNNLQCTILW